jgi:hypothetical protein
VGQALRGWGGVGSLLCRRHMYGMGTVLVGPWSGGAAAARLRVGCGLLASQSDQFVVHRVRMFRGVLSLGLEPRVQPWGLQARNGLRCVLALDCMPRRVTVGWWLSAQIIARARSQPPRRSGVASLLQGRTFSLRPKPKHTNGQAKNGWQRAVVAAGHDLGCFRCLALLCCCVLALLLAGTGFAAACARGGRNDSPFARTTPNNKYYCNHHARTHARTLPSDLPATGFF